MAIESLYPEVFAAGGLDNALDISFESLGLNRRVLKDKNREIFPGVYARVENHSRFSQVYMAANEKLYLCDFWKEGVRYGSGTTDCIQELAKSMDVWLGDHCSIFQLSDKFSFVQPSDKAAIFENRREVEFKWYSLLNDDEFSLIHPVIALAVEDRILSSLFPYTSLMTLCFSRCTGYPYTRDTPTVSPVLGSDEYLVRNYEGAIIGKGNASKVIEIVLSNMPSNISPAVKGTALDLQ
jgi:hypothetical protein